MQYYYSLCFCCFRGLYNLFFIFFPDGPSCPTEGDFLRRLLEAGATESSHYVSPTPDRDNMRGAELTTKNILQNIICSLNDMWHVNAVFVAAADQVAQAEDGIDSLMQ